MYFKNPLIRLGLSERVNKKKIPLVLQNAIELPPQRKEIMETAVETFGSMLHTIIYKAGYVGLTSCQDG